MIGIKPHLLLGQARDLAGVGAGRPLIGTCKSDPDLYRVADAFLAAQQGRHRADYDHLAIFSKREVVAQIEAATVAIGLLSGAHRGTPFQVFSAAILLKSAPR